MPNTLLTPSVIAKRALATLYNNAVLASLVYRDYDAEFNGAVGDTITVRMPATFVGKTFNRTTREIEIQEATEDSFPVTLDTIVDVSFEVTSEDLAMEIGDFAEQLLNPAVEAINQRIDADLAELIVDTAADTAAASGYASTAFTGREGAVAKIGRSKAPRQNRSVVFSPEGAGVALRDPLFVEADKSGATDGLREASTGRVFGFDTYQAEVFGEEGGSGDRAGVDGVAFHRDAVALVTRTLPKPNGIADSQHGTASVNGLGLRVIQDYDIKSKSDVCSVDILVGYEEVREDMKLALDLGDGS